ncbi:MAG TPA: S1C family serine protease [Kofleriaceae bacterium]|nr:S1C family serine protease [Kofleriaceae bacterium]
MFESAKIVVAFVLCRSWLVALATVVTCATLAASAASAFVEAFYLAPPGHGPTAPARAPEVTRARPKPDGAGLVERNMFCSSCAAASESTPADDFVPGAVLIATSLGAEPRATLRVPGSEIQGSFGIGDRIPGVGQIADIGWITVDVVDPRGRHGHLSLLGAATPEVTSAVPAADPWRDRVRAVDDHTFEVDRSLVRELVSGAVKPGGVRIVPVTDGAGKLAGLRVLGVSNHSLASALGLANGDVLTDVNGAHIESANTLINLYGKLDDLSTVELDGTRGAGAKTGPLALTLRLR